MPAYAIKPALTNDKIMKPKNIYIVSNRLPVTVIRSENGFSITPSSGGLATALQSVFQQQESRWIGWPGIMTTSKEEEEQIRALLEPLRCIPVFLSEEEFDGYYNGFSNAILWPVFHYHPGHCVFNPQYWEMYKNVNQKFAGLIRQYIQKKDFVWIHDYQLMLVPKYLHHAYMSYFHHIHFPAVEVFGIIPWRTELLEAVTKCRHLVFQTERDTVYFRQACKRYLPDNIEQRITQYNKISFHPISIDTQDFSLTAASVEVRKKRDEMKRLFNGQRIILSVDRLDYAKGILERLIAYRRLLIENPDLHQKITLVMIIVPSRTKVLSYEKHKKKVDEWVGNINAAFAAPNWRPVHYYYQHFDRETLCAYYALADLCLITSLRDGLNLVSKEYVACRNSTTGVLILSEMAGAAQELKYALKVHPYDTQQVKAAIYYALFMDKDEEYARMKYLRQQVFNYTVFDWLHKIFQEVFCLYEGLSYLFEQHLNNDILTRLKTTFKHARERYIFLDYDGCLRELELKPDKAKPTFEIYHLLEKLMILPATSVFLVSGRSRTDMDNWFGDTGVGIIAEHGAWYKEYCGNWKALLPGCLEKKAIFLPLLEEYARRIPEAFIEEKSIGYCLHFRSCKPEDVTRYLDQLVNDCIAYIKQKQLPYTCTVTPMQFEILPMDCDKGKGIQKFVPLHENAFVLAAGDDDTDEDMFKALPNTAFTFKIGRKETCAKIRIPEVNRFTEFLLQLADFPVA